MPVYKYKALDTGENPTTGVVEAASPREARQRLLQDNLFLLELTGASEEKSAGSGLVGGRKAEELALVTRQFATLTRAGVPLADSLAALVDVITTPRLQIVFRDLRESVTQGMSLEAAMRRHPRCFSPFYVSMVRVGEATGCMDDVLIRLAEYLHTYTRIRRKVRDALTYPLIMLAVGVLVVGFLVTYVVPRITTVLVESGRELPWPTEVLIGVSDFLGQAWWIMGLGGAGLVVLYRTLVATEGGMLARDTLKVSLPLLGEFLKKSLVSRFSLTFATLLKSGLPAVESLAIVRETVRNRLLEQAIDDIHDRIVEGQDISTIMQRSAVFPPLVAYMIAVGEKSGRLEEMLGILNEYYEEEIDSASARFTSILEPLMIIVLAVVVGFVVLAVILPIMDMGKLL